MANHFLLLVLAINAGVAVNAFSCGMSPDRTQIFSDCMLRQLNGAGLQTQCPVGTVSYGGGCIQLLQQQQTALCPNSYSMNSNTGLCLNNQIKQMCSTDTLNCIEPLRRSGCESNSIRFGGGCLSPQVATCPLNTPVRNGACSSMQIPYSLSPQQFPLSNVNQVATLPVLSGVNQLALRQPLISGVQSLGYQPIQMISG